MKATLKSLVIRLMEQAIQDIKTDNSNLTDEEAMDIMSVITHRRFNKYQACNYVGLKTSRFDDYVRAGVFPKGRKIEGSNELVWYQDELDTAIRNAKLNHHI